MTDDGDDLYEKPASAKDGESNVTPIKREGAPIAEAAPEQQQFEFEFEEAGKKQSFGDLLPKLGPDGKALPIKLKMQSKGKTFVGNDARPDVAAPVDRVTEQVVERVVIDYVRDESLAIERATVTYLYGTRGVWKAGSEAAKVALGIA